MRSLLHGIALLVCAVAGSGCPLHFVTNEWTPVAAANDRMEVRLYGDVAVVGEPVSLYRRVCPHPYPSGVSQRLACGLEYVGEGTVAALNGYQRAVVRLPAEVRYSPDLVIVRYSM
jgi:hypothetical protein